jgi:hypothetical protein
MTEKFQLILALKKVLQIFKISVWDHYAGKGAFQGYQSVRSSIVGLNDSGGCRQRKA